jgi:hypothetical protein
MAEEKEEPVKRSVHFFSPPVSEREERETNEEARRLRAHKTLCFASKLSSRQLVSVSVAEMKQTFSKLQLF